MRLLIREVARDIWNALLFFSLCVMLSSYLFIIRSEAEGFSLIPPSNISSYEDRGVGNIYLLPCTSDEQYRGASPEEIKRVLEEKSEGYNHATPRNHTR